VGRVAGYSSNVQTCTNMESEVVDAQKAMATATSVCTTQRQKCTAEDSKRQDAICAFGSKLQSKCSLSSEFLALVDQVNTKGTVHSSEDRDAEMETSHIVSCALQHFNDSGVAPGDNVIAACRASTPDLGDLRMYTTEFESTLSSFSCNDQSFTFSDASWTIPQGDGATSGQYERTAPFNYEFSVTTGSVPFPFCSAVSPAAISGISSVGSESPAAISGISSVGSEPEPFPIVEVPEPEPVPIEVPEPEPVPIEVPESCSQRPAITSCSGSTATLNNRGNSQGCHSAYDGNTNTGAYFPTNCIGMWLQFEFGKEITIDSMLLTSPWGHKHTIKRVKLIFSDGSAITPSTTIQPTKTTTLSFKRVRTSSVKVEILERWNSKGANRQIQEISFGCTPAS